MLLLPRVALCFPSLYPSSPALSSSLASFPLAYADPVWLRVAMYTHVYLALRVYRVILCMRGAPGENRPKIWFRCLCWRTQARASAESICGQPKPMNYMQLLCVVCSLCTANASKFCVRSILQPDRCYVWTARHMRLVLGGR